MTHCSPGSELRALFSVRTLAGQVFCFVLALVLLLVAAAAIALVVQSRRDSLEEAKLRTLSVAQTFADSPGIVEALGTKDPTAILQPRAEETRKEAHVDTVVVISVHGVRYTHPDPALIGKHVVGPYKEALAGHAFTRSFRGSQGPSVNSVVPVDRPDGKVVGVVSVGLTDKSVNMVADRSIPLSAAAAVVAAAITTGGAALVSRRLRRQTHGLGPAEMTRMYEHHDAVLHAVREGVLIVGADHRLMLANDEARRLLDLPLDAEGRAVADLGLPPATAELLVSGRTTTDEVLRSGNRLLAVSLRPTDTRGAPRSTVATLRDTTDLSAISGRAELVHERLLLLYEAGARIGTTLDVTRTAQELADVAIPGFADVATVDFAPPPSPGRDRPRRPDPRWTCAVPRSPPRTRTSRCSRSDERSASFPTGPGPSA